LEYSTVSSDDLVKICVSSNEPGAWEEFVKRFRPLIGAVVQKILYRWGSATPELVDDLMQSVFLKLFSKDTLSTFALSSKAPIEAYLRTVAAHVVLDEMKRINALKRGATTQAASTDDHIAVSDGSFGSAFVEQRVLLTQVEDHLRALGSSDRERLIFRLYYRQGLTAKDIAAIPTVGLSAKGVESLILRLTRSIRERLRVHDPGRIEWPNELLP
jgi:RNA polymerase sigma-70 factor (ECF subfamily)